MCRTTGARFQLLITEADGGRSFLGSAPDTGSPNLVVIDAQHPEVDVSNSDLALDTSWPPEKFGRAGVPPGQHAYILVPKSPGVVKLSAPAWGSAKPWSVTVALFDALRVPAVRPARVGETVLVRLDPKFDPVPPVDASDSVLAPGSAWTLQAGGYVDITRAPLAGESGYFSLVTAGWTRVYTALTPGHVAIGHVAVDVG